MRTLQIVAALEAVSLAVLLVNLVTARVEVITTFGGPLHGTAYLGVIAAAWLTPDAAGAGARPRALVPAVGGLLALRRMRRAHANRGHCRDNGEQ